MFISTRLASFTADLELANLYSFEPAPEPKPKPPPSIPPEPAAPSKSSLFASPSTSSSPPVPESTTRSVSSIAGLTGRRTPDGRMICERTSKSLFLGLQLTRCSPPPDVSDFQVAPPARYDLSSSPVSSSVLISSPFYYRIVPFTGRSFSLGLGRSSNTPPRQRDTSYVERRIPRRAATAPEERPSPWRKRITPSGDSYFIR